MFRKCVDLAPGNLLCRQSLRRVTEMKYGENGKGASNSDEKLRPIKHSLAKQKAAYDWNSVVSTCEDGLEINPWDHSLIAELGQALLMLNLREVASLCFHQALKLDPDNEHYRRMLHGLRDDDDSDFGGMPVPA